MTDTDPDPDADPTTLLAAAKAYAAMKSSREREFTPHRPCSCGHERDDHLNVDADDLATWCTQCQCADYSTGGRA